MGTKQISKFELFIVFIVSLTLGVVLERQLNGTSEAEAICLKNWQVKTSSVTPKGSIYCKVSSTPEVWQEIKVSQMEEYRYSN